MEKRHFEIRDRAGLEESRINEDFKDFITKYGTWMLLAVALATLGYNRYKAWQDNKKTEFGNAYRELSAASGSFALDRISWGTVDVDGRGVAQDANPDTLLVLSKEYKNLYGVSVVARLTAADALLRTIRTGVKPGSEVKNDGTPANPDDVLTPDQKNANLDQAEQLYNDVLTQARSRSGSMITQINAMYGLAAVAECRGKFDDAKAQYEAIVKLVDQTPFAVHVAVAKNRIASLDALKSLPPLLSKADLPRIPGLDPDPQPATPPTPPAAPATGTATPPADGSTPAPAGTTPPAGGGTPPPATPQANPPANPPTTPEPAPGTNPK